MKPSRRTIPSLNWLRVFEAAARMESFARAAEILNMSNSAVSQQIKSLEKHLQTQLFTRGSKHVELTDAGNAFLPVVRQSLVSVEETADSLFGINRTNTLTLQATLIFGTSWLSPRLAGFYADHPDIQIHLSGAYHDEDYLRPGPELRILFGPVHRSWGQCDFLFNERIYPVALPEVGRTINKVNDFLDHTLIQVSVHNLNWNHVLRAGGIQSIPLQRFSFTDTTEMALFLAASGNGIALARGPTTDWTVNKLGLEPCGDAGGFPSPEAYFLVYKNLESLSPASRSFREWLLDEVRSTEAQS